MPTCCEGEAKIWALHIFTIQIVLHKAWKYEIKLVDKLWWTKVMLSNMILIYITHSIVVKFMLFVLIQGKRSPFY